MKLSGGPFVVVGEETFSAVDVDGDAFLKVVVDFLTLSDLLLFLDADPSTTPPMPSSSFSWPSSAPRLRASSR